MSGPAVDELYRGYIDELARYAFHEVDVRRIVRDQGVDPTRLEVRGSMAVQKLRLRGVIRTEIASIKADFLEEFEAFFSALSAEASVVDGIDAVFETVLDADPVVDAAAPGRREAVERALQRDLVRAGRALEPLVGQTDALSAIRGRWSLDGAQHRLLRWFDATTDRSHLSEDVTMSVDTTSVAWLPRDAVDYSDEALRVLERGRDYIARVIAADLDATYAERAPLTALG
jgi:hypothetical protein